MNYSSLGKYYDDLFAMSYHHGYPISEMEALMPFERDLMIQLVNTHISETNEMRRLEEMRLRDIQNARRPKF